MDKGKQSTYSKSGQLCIADKYGTWKKKVRDIAAFIRENNPDELTPEELAKYEDTRCISTVVKELIAERHRML